MITCDECEHYEKCDETGFCIAEEIETNRRLNAREEDRATSRQLAFERAKSGNLRDLIDAMGTP